MAPRKGSLGITHSLTAYVCFMVGLTVSAITAELRGKYDRICSLGWKSKNLE